MLNTPVSAEELVRAINNSGGGTAELPPGTVTRRELDPSDFTFEHEIITNVFTYAELTKYSTPYADKTKVTEATKMTFTLDAPLKSTDELSLFFVVMVNPGAEPYFPFKCSVSTGPLKRAIDYGPHLITVQSDAPNFLGAEPMIYNATSVLSVDGNVVEILLPTQYEGLDMSGNPTGQSHTLDVEDVVDAAVIMTTTAVAGQQSKGEMSQ